MRRAHRTILHVDMKRRARRLCDVAVLVAAVGVGSLGCSGSAAQSCDEMRDELAALLPQSTATAAWDDIVELQDVVERGLALERKIEERCESDP